MSDVVTQDGEAGLGVGAVELLVDVLSQSQSTGPTAAAPTDFYDRLCEAVCRLARMRRAVIFQYDAGTRRVRAVGVHAISMAPFADAQLSFDSLPITARALAEDVVLEVVGDLTGQASEEFAELVSEPARLVCAPMAAAGRALGVILADRPMSAPPLHDADRSLLWTLGKVAALVSVARTVSTQSERARALEQRIDLAREIHEGVIQRLFGVSMALDGDGDLPESARQRCATETQSALAELRSALQRPLGRAPRATQTTLVAEITRLARLHPALGLESTPSPAARRSRYRRRSSRSLSRSCVKRSVTRSSTPSQATCPCTSGTPTERSRWRSSTTASLLTRAGWPEWDCDWRRLRRCSSTVSSSSANVSRGPGRSVWWSPTRTAMTEARAAQRSPTRLRVLVVDDHDVVHWGFRLMLTQLPWVERCLSAQNGSDALELAAHYRPHVALVDLFIGEESGAEVCERSGPAAVDAGAAVLRRGRDLVTGGAGRGRLRVRLQRLAGATDRGGGPAGRPRQERVRRHEPQGAMGLSERERAVLELMASGATNPEIGEALHISRHTVKEHCSAVYRKLGVRTAGAIPVGQDPPNDWSPSDTPVPSTPQ